MRKRAKRHKRVKPGAVDEEQGLYPVPVSLKGDFNGDDRIISD